MAVKQDQGFLKELNLNETPNAAAALNVLGGAGISDDLLIIRNNLRNISSTAYESISDGFFFFGSDNEFVFTNDDVITLSENVNVGSTNLIAGTNYYVCNSDTKTKFKLSTTPSTSGVNTITVTSVSPTNFYFFRNDAVYQENISNFIKPTIQDEYGFDYIDGLSVNEAVDVIETAVDYGDSIIPRKYSTSSNTTSNVDVNIEGIVTINDPTAFNFNSTNLSSQNSPGIFIGTTRAFSSSEAPWTKVGTALSTLSSSVSVSELSFNDEITITGISTELGSSVQVSTFTHKFPVIINNQTYYLLLRT